MPAEIGQALLRRLGAFNFEIDYLRSRLNRTQQNCNLIVHGARKPAMIRFVTACGEHVKFGITLQETLDYGESGIGRGEMVQAKLEKRIPIFYFEFGGPQKSIGIR